MKRYKQAGTQATCGTHRVSREDLSAYMDTELPLWKQRSIRRHLKKCPICAGYVQRLQHTDTFLRDSEDVAVSEQFLTTLMARASEITAFQPQESVWTRVQALVQRGSAVADTLRDGIRTRSPVYIFLLTFAVFSTVGATLYRSANNRSDRLPHTLTAPAADARERLISFEVIRHEPPKRLLTTHLQQK